MIRNTDSIRLAAGDGKVSFVDIRDIGSVAATVLTENDDEHIGKSYDLTGPESLTLMPLKYYLVNQKKNYVNISEDQLRQGIKEMGINDWHANVIVELLRITRDGSVSAVSSAVEKVTGKEPVSFSMFAKEHASFLK